MIEASEETPGFQELPESFTPRPAATREELARLTGWRKNCYPALRREMSESQFFDSLQKISSTVE